MTVKLTATALLCLATACTGAVAPDAEPLFEASPAAAITAAEATKWNTAASWGDHADAGYLKAETEPQFSASPAAAVTSVEVGRWNSSFAWGDHAAAGYLKSETESLFRASPAAAIATGDLSGWNAAVGWGDHSLAGYLKAEAEPKFSASPAAAIAGSDVGNWNAAFAWGNHANAGYLVGESDPKVGALSMSSVGHWDGTSLVDGTLVDTGGGVGIGVAAPNGELDVYSTLPTVLDQSQTQVAYSTGSTDQWQSFTAGATGKLARLDLMVGSPVYPSSSPGTLQIYAGDGTGGALLSTTAVTFAPVNGQYQSFTLSAPPSVTAGQIYSYRFSAPSITVGWVYGKDNAYAGGHCSFNPGCDFVFKTYVAPKASVLNVGNGVVTVGALFHLAPLAAAPAAPSAGDVYYDSATNHLNYFNGTSWVAL